MDAYVNSQRPKTMNTHQATQDGLAARQRPSAGAYNEGDDVQAGGDDIDDGLWDADIDDPAAANPRKKQKHRDAAASAETIVKKKKKKKMEEDHAATEDALNKKKKKIKKKRDCEVDTNIPAAAEHRDGSAARCNALGAILILPRTPARMRPRDISRHSPGHATVLPRQW